MAAPSSVTERERKYEIVAGSGVPRLVGVAGVETQDDPVEHVLDASYYDTETFRLARSGITLRRRVGGHDAGWHLKLPVSADERQEIQLPLGGDTEQGARPAPAPGAGVHAGGEAGADRAPAHRPLRPPAGRRRRPHHRDPHRRPRDRRSRRGDRPARRMARAGAGARPRDRARPARGVRPRAGRRRRVGVAVAVEAAAPDRRPRAGAAARPKKPTAGAIVLASLREHHARLRRADVGVRLDVEDSVHQMRVATRKLRSALRTFGSIVDKDATAPLAAELKWLGQQLAPARDTEVTEARLARAARRRARRSWCSGRCASSSPATSPARPKKAAPGRWRR